MCLQRLWTVSGIGDEPDNPEKIETLQRKLYAKAKAEPGFRFYLLYDKIYRADILAHAYALAKANKGAPGVDDVTFAMIEAAGVEEWLAALAGSFGSRPTAKPVRRVLIPKPGGGERPLGIPTIRDRVVQTAAKLCWSLCSRPISTRSLRLSARSQCERCGASGARPPQGRIYGRGGCGFVEVLRHDSARRASCSVWLVDQATSMCWRSSRCG